MRYTLQEWARTVPRHRVKLWYIIGLLLLPDVATRVPGPKIASFSQLLR